MRHQSKPVSGFTLAELLISLAILGVIAAFTIPKILLAQQNSSYASTAKEAAGMVAAAFAVYKQNNTLSASTTPGALTQYMNYTSVKTSGYLYGSSRDCSSTASFICLNLHSGGVLWMEKGVNFGGTNTTNALYFLYEPNPGQNTTPLSLYLYYTGRLVSDTGIDPNAVTSNYTFTPGSDPSWFNW